MNEQRTGIEEYGVHALQTERKRGVGQRALAKTSAPIPIPIRAIPSAPKPTTAERLAGGWRGLAECGRVDPEIFFPIRASDTEEAKKVCAGCPVRKDCKQEALDNDERFGVWGGLSEKERRRLKKKNSTGIIAS